MKYLITLISSLLVACGGGGSDQGINGVKSNLQYGQSSSVQIGGINLSNSLVTDLGDACPNATWSSNSTTQLAVLICTPTKVGDLALTIKDHKGVLIYSTTVDVPKPQVLLNTSKGAITVELDPNAAPKTVDNFLAYVSAGHYKDTLFHRVIPNFVVQAGGFSTGLVAKIPNEPIELESNNGLRNLRGSIAMARTTEPNSATSQFYINLVDNVSLDYVSAAKPGYAVFGSVVSGLETADAIAAVATGSVGGLSDVPLEDVLISAAIRLK